MNFEGIDKVSPVPYYYQLEQLLQDKDRENSTFWSGMSSKQAVSSSDRTDK